MRILIYTCTTCAEDVAQCPVGEEPNVIAAEYAKVDGHLELNPTHRISESIGWTD